MKRSILLIILVLFASPIVAFGTSGFDESIDPFGGEIKKLIDPREEVDVISPENPLENFLDFINPFWKVPEIDNANFRFTIDIPVQNDGPFTIVPTGKLYITDSRGVDISGIGVIGDSRSSSGKLVDYIPINESGSSIESGESRTFSVLWRGFGDQYIDNGVPIITFTDPAEYYNTENYDINFWEKLIVHSERADFTARAELEYIHPVTHVRMTETEPIHFAVTYPVITRTINTGFVSIVLLLLLFVCSPIFFRKKTPHTSARTRSTGQTFAEIEELISAEKEKIKEKQLLSKKSPPKNNVKNPAQKDAKKDAKTAPKKRTPNKKTPPKTRPKSENS